MLIQSIIIYKLVPFFSDDYLVDSDEGGKAIIKKLTRCGIDRNKIFKLSVSARKNIVLEDFVKREVYISSVNYCIQRRHGNAKQITLSDITDENRPMQLKKWCEEIDLKPPNRREIAYKILEHKQTQDLVLSNRRRSLESLFNKITKVLGTVTNSE